MRHFVISNPSAVPMFRRERLEGKCSCPSVGNSLRRLALHQQSNVASVRLEKCAGERLCSGSSAMRAIGGDREPKAAALNPAQGKVGAAERHDGAEA